MTTSSPQHFDWLKKLGADEVYDYVRFLPPSSSQLRSLTPHPARPLRRPTTQHRDL